MRVLIFSCRTEKGPDACGKALLEQFQKLEIPCKMEDALTFLTSKLSHWVVGGIPRLYRCLPGVFRAGDRYSGQHPGLFEDYASLYRMLTSGAEQMYSYFILTGFDTVVCTHSLPALMVTEVMRRHNRFLRTCFVSADYTCPPGCGQSDLDVYFISDESLVNDFVRCGIGRDKVRVSGVPIQEQFRAPSDKKWAKQKLGLSLYTPHLLIMGENTDCGPIRDLVRRISRKIQTNSSVTVLCGADQDLYEQLKQRYREDSRIRVLTFVRNMAMLMDSADLLLTTPCGVVATQAVQKKLPMVFLPPVTWCERGNVRYFISEGIALSAETPKALADLACILLSDGERLTRMRKGCQNQPDNTAAVKIAQYVAGLRGCHKE